MADSPFRKLTKVKLRSVKLSGRVADLGGRQGADYHDFMVTRGKVTTINIDPTTRPEVVHNLEETLPFPDNYFDAVLAINVLEHIHLYSRVIREARRIVRPGGRF